MAKRRSKTRARASGAIQTLNARREQLRREQLLAERARAAELARLGLEIDVEQATRDGMDTHFVERFKEAVAADATEGRLPDFTAREAEQARRAHEESTRSDSLNLPTSMPRWSWSTGQYSDAELIKRAAESDGAALSKGEAQRVGNLVWNAKPASEDMVEQIEKAVDKFPDEYIVSPSPIYQDFRTVMDNALDGLERKVKDLPGGPERAARVTSRFVKKMEPYAEMLTAELEAATQRVALLVHQSLDDPDGIVVNGPDEEFRIDTANMVLGYLGEAAKDRFLRALDEAGGDLTDDGMRRRVRGDALEILRAAFEEATRVRDNAVAEIERLRQEIADAEGVVASWYDVIRDIRRDEAVAQRALAVYKAEMSARKEGAA